MCAIWDLSRPLADLRHLVFLTSEEGEAVKLYLRTTCRSLAFPLLHVFTTGVRVQLLFLLDDPAMVGVNNLKLLAW